MSASKSSADKMTVDFDWPDGSGARTPEQAAEEALLRLTGSTGFHERLPMLDVVLDRLVRLLTSAVRQFTSRSAEVEVSRYSILKFSEALQILEPGLISVATATPWDGKILLVADSNAIFSLVEILLGGRQRPFGGDMQRSYTSIERRLTQRVLDLVCENLSAAFTPITGVEFRGERIETNPEFVAICRENTPTALVTLNLKFERTGGKISIAIPYTTLEPVRKTLLKMFMSEKFGRDPIWERHLNAEVHRTELTITGVLHERMVTLGEVASWKTGMTVMLPVSVHKPAARIMCNGVALYEGEMGQSNGSLAVRIEAPTNVEKEFIDALIRD